MFKSKRKNDKNKRILSVCFLLSIFLFLSGCQEGADATTEVNVVEDLTSMAEGVMSYNEIWNAKEGAAVVVDIIVKEKTEWEDYKAVITAQDSDGLYYIEDLACSEDFYNELLLGTKMRITGYKDTSSENILITDASFEILE